MDTLVIVAIVVLAVALIALFATVGRRRRLENRRGEAQELRTEAARRHELAERERTAAAEQAQRADEIDPDTEVSDSEPQTTGPGRFQRTD
jgi:hypothetical protein